MTAALSVLVLGLDEVGSGVDGYGRLKRSTRTSGSGQREREREREREGERERRRVKNKLLNLRQ